MTVISTVIGGFVGFFFTFAGFSKLTGAGPMGGEMQGGFLSGTWPAMWGIPALPFLYAVGAAEAIIGPMVMAGAAGMLTTSSILASSAGAFITFNATLSHVLKGDPVENVGFCATICSLFTIFSITKAMSLAGKIKLP